MSNFSAFAWFLRTDAEEIAEFICDEKRTRWLEDYAAFLALAEDEREAQNREAAGVVEWLHENNAAALYMEGTEPSPFIWGGEVCYPSEYRPATEPDDDMPF